jgi:hypothetical protein
MDLHRGHRFQSLSFASDKQQYPPDFVLLRVVPGIEHTYTMDNGVRDIESTRLSYMQGKRPGENQRLSRGIGQRLSERTSCEGKTWPAPSPPNGVPQIELG